VDFMGEPVGSHRRGELGAEDLQRDLAVMLEVVGQIHRGHAPDPDFALDAVAPAQRGSKTIQDVGHGCIK